MHFLMEAETWVAIAFVIFLGILAYVGVHRTILGALDKRAARIKAELDEARQLRDEAKALLVEYQNKKGEAEREADAILAGAKADAERLAADADAKLQDFITRRTKMAETKIAQAEAQALADVRAAAAEAAVAAAEKVLTKSATGKVADALVAQGIADVQKKLNLSPNLGFTRDWHWRPSRPVLPAALAGLAHLRGFFLSEILLISSHESCG